MIYFISDKINPVYHHKDIEYVLEYFKDASYIEVDTETKGFDPYTKELLCIQLGDNNNQFVIDCSCNDMSKLKSLLESKELLMQNAQFDLRFLYFHNIYPRKVYDTYLAERVLSMGIQNHRKALDSLVYRYCKIVLDKTVRGAIHREGLSTRVIKYAADDVKYLNQIRIKQLDIIDNLDLRKALDLENKFVLALSYIAFCGIGLNESAWTERYYNNKKVCDEYLAKLEDFVISNNHTPYIDNQLDLFSDETKTLINWDSAQQVGDYFKYIGIDIVDSEGKESVESKNLQKKEHPIIDIYLSYKKYQKQISTYGLSFINKVNPVSKRLHTTFTQIKDTSRISSGDGGNGKGINFQNIPGDAETRACFQAENGKILPLYTVMCA